MRTKKVLCHNIIHSKNMPCNYVEHLFFFIFRLLPKMTSTKIQIDVSWLRVIAARNALFMSAKCSFCTLIKFYYIFFFQKSCSSAKSWSRIRPRSNSMGTFGLSILGLGFRLPDHLERSPFKWKGTNFLVETIPTL